jgi:hypothetical protein
MEHVLQGRTEQLAAGGQCSLVSACVATVVRFARVAGITGVGGVDPSILPRVNTLAAGCSEEGGQP